MARFGRFVLIGCGGLVILGVLLVVVPIAVGPGGGVGPSSEQAEKKTPAVGIGQETKVGDAVWLVNNTRLVKQLTTEPLG